MIPNRPRRQGSQRLFSFPQLGSGHNLSILPARVEPLGAVQSYSRCRTAELRRRIWQDRVVFAKTITPCLSGPHFANGLHCLGKDSCPKMCRNTQVRKPTLAPPHSSQKPSPIECHRRCHHPLAASQCIRPLIRSRRQSNANQCGPRQSATSVRDADSPSTRENSRSRRKNMNSRREYDRRNDPRRYSYLHKS